MNTTLTTWRRTCRRIKRRNITSHTIMYPPRRIHHPIRTRLLRIVQLVIARPLAVKLVNIALWNRFLIPT
ncbi:predicted protein [Plenodomus lingam JN3]|uniref:Predicted protein n=1 Tax=Leptosphaeria maculans (strain JN3 / isolate v23.1.3 / race Av1-4-5-6-7-8) TaxID=985895 RepID=E4ZPW6_LEPMJ|nr:predicted protein [Plenodomus lingam JN3]CBX93501.1 predicted protein [Plenodomus lingam JN3]